LDERIHVSLYIRGPCLVSSHYGLYTLIIKSRVMLVVVLFQTFQDIRNQTNSIKKTMDTREQSVSVSSSLLLPNSQFFIIDAASSLDSFSYEPLLKFCNVTVSSIDGVFT
jgi:hypothetical protein